MEGDFSRFTFNPKKNYNRVFLQQGRVQLDADWNEQVDILTHRDRTEITDLVGHSAVPIENPGFGLLVRHGLQFDGLDGYVYVEEADRFSFSKGKAFTLEAWFMPQLGGTGGVICSKPHQSVPFGEYTLLLQTDGRVVFQFAELVDEVELSEEFEIERISLRTLATQSSANFGQFNHISVTAKKNSIAIYLNGELAAKTSYRPLDIEANASFLIGATQHNRQISQVFQGIISKIRVWKGARSQFQIKTYMSRTISNTSEELLGNWDFDDGQGLIVTDRSGFAHHGVLAASTPNGVPTWCPPTLWISKGRCYVEGLLCENNDDIPYTQQDDSAKFKNVRSASSEPLLVYLDVWQRLITSIQDPNIREIALGGPDTATRTEVVWQVKSVPANSAESLSRREHLRGRLRMRKQPFERILGNFLYRIEIHNSGGYFGQRSGNSDSILQIEHVSYEKRQIKVNDFGRPSQNFNIGQCVEIFDSANHNSGFITHITDRDSANNVITLNQLSQNSQNILNYESPCLHSVATFKWSRENGSVAFPLQAIDGVIVTLHSSVTERPTLNLGDWIEISDDKAILGGRVFPLCQITDLRTTDSGSIQVILNREPSNGVGRDLSLHPLLRRWDQNGLNVDANKGVIPIHADSEWVTLESGIQVSFVCQASFHSQDYWWAPARANSQSITWPHDRHAATAQTPVGIQHHYFPLAFLYPDARQPKVKDLRNFFSPLKQGFVRKSGDTMTGPLTVGSSLTVSGESLLHGDVRVGKLYGRLADGIVSTEQVSNGAISLPKLATDVGVVPPTFSILGQTPKAPPGYKYAETCFQFKPVNPRWEYLATQLPLSGQVRTVAVGNKLYCLWKTGEMWSYDLSAQSELEAWSQETSLPAPIRYAYALGVIDGSIYVVGGYELEPYRISNRADVYDVDLCQWTAIESMPTARSHLGIGVVDGKLFAIGGLERSWWGRRNSFESIANEMYCPVDNRWIRKRSLPRPRAQLGVCSCGGKVYAIGGVSTCMSGILTHQPTRRTDVYSPSDNLWTAAENLPSAKVDVSAIETNGSIFVLGREGSQENTHKIDVYNPGSNTWPYEILLNGPICNYGVTSAHGVLYIVGGKHSGRIEDSIQTYHLSNSYYVFTKLG